MVQAGQEVVGFDHVDFRGVCCVEGFLEVLGLGREDGGACLQGLGGAGGGHDRQVGERGHKGGAAGQVAAADLALDALGERGRAVGGNADRLVTGVTPVIGVPD